MRTIFLSLVGRHVVRLSLIYLYVWDCIVSADHGSAVIGCFSSSISVCLSSITYILVGRGWSILKLQSRNFNRFPLAGEI